MKKIIIFISAVFITFFSSCDDFFDVEPKGSISEEDYSWQINNLRISLNAVYNLIQSEDFQRSELIFGEAISDNIYTRQDNGGTELTQLLNFQFNTENSHILKKYEVNYRGINLANQVISHVQNLNFNENYSTGYQEVRYILGQAKLMRALFYFNLVRTYGGVTIQSEKSTLSRTAIPRSSTDEVYAYIEKDLREACLILYRDRFKEQNAGQAGIGAGLGILMKVLAYQASPGINLQHPEREKKWKEVCEIGGLFIDGKSMSYENMLKFSENYTESWEDLCKRLAMTDLNVTPQTEISGDVANVHGLVNFNELFRLKNKFNKEILWEINHYDYSSLGLDPNSVDEKNKLYVCLNENESQYVGVAPTQNLMEMKDSDPRGMYTVAPDTNTDFFLDSNGNRASLTWFNIAGGWVFSKYMVYPNEGVVADRNYIVMRYAEALLWYAEALNESENQVRATEVLNRVRARAAKLITAECPDSKYNKCLSCPLYNIMPYQEVKKNIQYERRIELAAELDRWYDIVRLDIVNERMTWMSKNNVPDKNSGKPRWRGKYFKRGVNEIFPIPQQEVTISNGVITQNFGY